MELQILGAGCDVGRSCILLTLNNKKLLLDCGAHPGYADARRFPEFNSIPSETLKSLDAILISHFHFDHAGALPYLTERLQCQAKVYMNEPTKELTRLMLQDLVTTSNSRGDFCPFDSRDVERCISNVCSLEEDMTIGEANDIRVQTYYAGHTLGAVMINISSGGKSAFYSGDYSIDNDGHLRVANVPMGLRPDVFITEATYCTNTRPQTRLETEEELVSAVKKTLENDGKVLVAISAFGRVHGICNVLQGHIHEVPLYVTSGLAWRALKVYEKHCGWMENECDQCADMQGNKRRRSRFANKCEHRLVEKAEEFHRNEHWQHIYARGPMILMATPGNVSTGVSRDVLNIWGADERNLLIATGFSFGNFVQRGGEVRCGVVNLRGGGHADAAGIERVCRMVNPRNVVLVHGESGKIKQFRGELESSLGVRCLAPENGEIVVIEEAKEIDVDLTNVTEEWRVVLKDYQKMLRRATGNTEAEDASALE